MNRMKECMLAVTKDSTAIYRYLEFTDNFPIMQKVIKKEPSLYSLISPKLESNLTLAELAMKCRSNYDLLSDELKKNRRIILALFKNAVSSKQVEEIYNLIEDKDSIYVLEGLCKSVPYETVIKLLTEQCKTIEECLEKNKENIEFVFSAIEIINWCPLLIPYFIPYLRSNWIVSTLAKHGEVIDKIMDEKLERILNESWALIYLARENEQLLLQCLRMIEIKKETMIKVMVEVPTLYKFMVNEGLEVPLLTDLNDAYYQHMLKLQKLSETNDKCV